MMAEDRPRGLGRGLSALIGDEVSVQQAAAPAKGARALPVAFLRPNPHQPRKTFREEELRDLATSIREKGLLQPILVRPITGQNDAYEIVAGERRWRAAQMAKLHDVPVVVREISNAEALELAIIENVQREDLNAIEEAAAYHELSERYGYTQERLAEEIGKSRSHIANTLRLLKLPETVKAMIREGKLTAGHARTLIGLANPEARAKEIVTGGMNVRQAEQHSAAHKGKAKKPHHKDADTRALESNLANALGLKVEIAHKASGAGEVRISYKTLEQLDDICRRLSNPKGI
jgi:ParB family chromosome partitioning protein